jgi:hypothetical protein
MEKRTVRRATAVTAIVLAYTYGVPGLTMGEDFFDKMKKAMEESQRKRQQQQQTGQPPQAQTQQQQSQSQPPRSLSSNRGTGRALMRRSPMKSLNRLRTSARRKGQQKSRPRPDSWTSSASSWACR